MSTPQDPHDSPDGPTGLALHRRRAQAQGGKGGRDVGRLARRYGPYAVVVVLGLVAFAVFGGGGGDGAGGDAEVASDEGPGDDALTEREQLILSGPMTAERAELEGVNPDFGPDCDTTTGRIELPTVYAPPCVVPFDGDNGGATGMGVSEDTIKVVAYVIDPDIDALTTAAAGLAGQDLDPQRQAETVNGYVDLFNEVYETYGRQVELEIFRGTGAMDDFDAAQADAIAIAEKEPFAVIGGPLQASAVFADELAARGVVCLPGCATGLSQKSFLDEHAPYVVMGGGASGREPLDAEALAKLVGPGKAERAGDPALRQQDRVYGMVRFNDPDGTQQESFERFRDAAAERGIELETDVEYFFDLARQQEDARTIVTRLKQARVTTVLLATEPLMPGALTQEATAQDYHPEWILMNSAFAVDSARFARTYDQEQWANAFGLTNTATPEPPGRPLATRLYQWAYDTEPPSGNFAGQLLPPLRMLFDGVHVAGPELTPETFDDGLLRYPPSGGGPTAPLHQPHNTTDGDAAVIWWDPEAAGVDPDGTESVGFYRFAKGGQRYQHGEIPESPDEAGLFDVESSVIQYEDFPPEDKTPDYEPPDL